MIPRIAVAALAGEFEVGFSDTPQILDRVYMCMEKLGYDLLKVEEIISNGAAVVKAAEFLKVKDFDILCICVGTWSEDHYLLDLLDYFNVPVIIRAFPGIETGSLCGAHQICCVLRELGRPYFFVYGEPEEEKALSEIGKISMAAALSNRLRHVKIGNIGGRIKGMTEIAYDELEIKDKTGVRIVNLDEGELLKAYENISSRMASELWDDFKSGAGKVSATDEHGVNAARYYAAIKQLVNLYGLEGICIKCYPLYMGKICLGYAALSDEGVVCGCEGDVNNTVSMKILYELSGQPVHNTDLLYPDTGTNTILFSHCGSGAFSLAGEREDINLGPVRLANTGVCALFPARPGKVTLINLVGRKETLRLSVIVGDALECGMEFPGNPLKVRFKRDVLDIAGQIAFQGIGHHWIGGYGDFSMELEYFCRLRQIKYIRL